MYVQICNAKCKQSFIVNCYRNACMPIEWAFEIISIWLSYRSQSRYAKCKQSCNRNACTPIDWADVSMNFFGDLTFKLTLPTLVVDVQTRNKLRTFCLKRLFIKMYSWAIVVEREKEREKERDWRGLSALRRSVNCNWQQQQNSATRTTSSAVDKFQR